MACTMHHDMLLLGFNFPNSVQLGIEHGVAYSKDPDCSAESQSRAILLSRTALVRVKEFYLFVCLFFVFLGRLLFALGEHLQQFQE